MKYETAFRFLPPASLDRGNGLLCYNVVKPRNQGGGSRLSRPVVGLSDPDGRAIGMIGILHHLRELDKARIYAESLIKNAPDPVFVSDLEGNILQANDAVRSLLTGS